MDILFFWLLIDSMAFSRPKTTLISSSTTLTETKNGGYYNDFHREEMEMVEMKWTKIGWIFNTVVQSWVLPHHTKPVVGLI